MKPKMTPNDYTEMETALQNAFNVAAEKSTGAAKPKFERLRDANAAANAATVESEATAALGEFLRAMGDVELFAKTDKSAEEVLTGWRENALKATEKVRKSIGFDL